MFTFMLRLAGHAEEIGGGFRSCLPVRGVRAGWKNAPSIYSILLLLRRAEFTDTDPTRPRAAIVKLILVLDAEEALENNSQRDL